MYVIKEESLITRSKHMGRWKAVCVQNKLLELIIDVDLNRKKLEFTLKQHAGYFALSVKLPHSTSRRRAIGSPTFFNVHFCYYSVIRVRNLPLTNREFFWALEMNLRGST